MPILPVGCYYRLPALLHGERKLGSILGQTDGRLRMPSKLGANELLNEVAFICAFIRSVTLQLTGVRICQGHCVECSVIYPILYFPAVQTSKGSAIPHKTVPCQSGDSYARCCLAKTPKASTCSGTKHKMKEHKAKKKPGPELGASGQSTCPPSNAPGPFPWGCPTQGNYGNTVCDGECSTGQVCMYTSGGLEQVPRCTCETSSDCTQGNCGRIAAQSKTNQQVCEPI